MDLRQLQRYTEAAIVIARQAGERILEVYERGFDVETKRDGSPVTTADRRSHGLIVEELARLNADIPVLSEESSGGATAGHRDWTCYWLIDPLDGTKEFINRNGEFTVNIALIQERHPVAGVVYTPVQDLMHWAHKGGKAYRRVGSRPAENIEVREYSGGAPTVVASRSHGRGNLDKFLRSVKHEHGGYELTSLGSALKICIVAEGGADVYPRLGPTSEWDTAAAHCVLDVAGGKITDRRGAPLFYNKPSVLNPWFIASGGGSEDWCRHLAGIETEKDA